MKPAASISAGGGASVTRRSLLALALACIPGVPLATEARRDTLRRAAAIKRFSQATDEFLKAAPRLLSEYRWVFDLSHLPIGTGRLTASWEIIDPEPWDGNE